MFLSSCGKYWHVSRWRENFLMQNEKKITWIYFWSEATRGKVHSLFDTEVGNICIYRLAQVCCTCCVQKKCHASRRLTVPTEFEKVPEKPQWCWLPSSQSYQGCRSSGCWFKRCVTHLDFSSFFVLFLHEKGQREPSVKVFFCCVLQARVIPSVCWNWGTTDCRPTQSTRASTQSGIKSSLCQFPTTFSH